MLGAGGGWGGGGGGPWDGMVGVMSKVEIVGVDVKLSRGAAVALLRCVGGEVIVMLGASGSCWLSRSEGRIVRVRNS